MNKDSPDFKFFVNRFPAKTRIVMVLMVGVIILLSNGCGAPGSSERVRLKELDLAPLEEMPDYVRDASREVQEAYRFAVANPDLLEQIPCFCGCNSMGHMNNLDCYVDEFGQITEFDNHAAY